MAKFQPGQSGNPTGRKPGSGRIQRFRAAIEKDVPDIIDAMVANAKSGDSSAASLLLSRVIPPVRPQVREVQLALPSDNPAAATQVVINALAVGDISVDTANQLMDVISKQQNIVQIPELENRLKSIEDRISGSN